MALSAEQRKILRMALASSGNDGIADQVADMLDAAGNADPGAAVADVAEADADATYGQPEADLINELKAQMNALLASLRSNGTIAE